jgi:eukaryotic-like serine/threonine-protein kinase
VSDSPQTSALSDAPAAWQQGLTVGRYSLLSRLAVGGMAEIWLARQLGPQGFEKFVVIKRILDGLGTDPEFVGMFLDEARIAAQLNHPHIVQIFDLGEEAGAFYIAMEYLPGENLAAIARSAARNGRTLPPSLAVRIIADAAEGLAYAHAKTGPDGKLLGIVHRDVSPQNIFVTYDGVVKVLDFGIAKAAIRESQTMAGQIKGKTSYMSPEQARGQTIDGRSDIFALGILLFELVTRTRLFHHPDPFQALHLVAGDDPIPLAHEVRSEIPLDLSSLIARALSRDPEKRYPTARHFHSDLEEWMRGQTEVPGRADLASYMGESFAARIQERARLLEAARNGELTPASARAARTSSLDSMPGGSLPREDVTSVEDLPRRPTPRQMLIGGAVLLVLLTGIFYALFSGEEDIELPTPAELPVPAPPPEPPVLTIETDPPGAMIMVDGREAGLSPLTIEALELGEHTVGAALQGRKPAERQVKLEKPGERAMVVLALAPEPPPTPPKPETPRQSKKTPQPGKLTLDTTPWTRVFLRGKKLGDTPLIGVSLPAGKHQLKLVNEEKKISTIIEVDIRSGQTTAKKLRL